MELTKNQKIVGVSLAGVIAWLLYRKKVVLQSHRVETPTGPAQVVVPVPTSAGTGAIANVLGNVLPSAHTDLVYKALSQVPLVIQGDRMAPTRISTIADVQHALNFLRICPTPLRDTGVLDSATVNCIKAYQSIMQLPITGMADPTTKMALESSMTKSAISVHAPAIQSAVAAAPTVNPVIQTERDLQRSLNILGASPKLKEDGKIGKITTAAIKAFQVVHGLVADGLAGPDTKAAIASAVATPPAITAANSGVAHGDFGYIPPPVTHPWIPGLMGAGGGPGRYIPPPHEYRPEAPREHRFERRPDAPIEGFQDPEYMRSWERWRQVHGANAQMTDYLGWKAQHLIDGAQINGDDAEMGFARGAMNRGGFHRPAPPRFHSRAHAFALGVPYEEIDVVEVNNDGDGDDDQVDISGEAAFGQARYSFEEAFARGDRRFEHPRIGPHAPPLPGEHEYHAEEHRPFFGERRGLFDYFRGWLGLGRHERRIDDNPYIPPAATPEVMNFDPFANTTAPAVERWHPDDLRRREEMERRGFARTAPIEPGRPAPPVIDHPTPPAPPPPRF